MSHANISRLKKILLRLFVTVAAIVLLIYIAFRVSPWPAALLIRSAFNKDAKRVSAALEKHLPSGVSAILHQQYLPGDKDAFLDVYYPSTLEQTDSLLPTIVWIHGGGWISGNKEQVGNYCRILASKGYTVAAIDYSIAPEKKYPLPVLQTNAALGYLTRHHQRFHINPACLLLAGDSGGSHIAAQVAAALADSSYATLIGVQPAIERRQLQGLLLYCGPYSIDGVNLEGAFGNFLRTVLWSYSGSKDFSKNTEFTTASVISYVNENFPAAFISVGNGDPLATQSYALAEKLGRLGVYTDTLFFAADYLPALPHEYQFNLDTDAGQLALSRSIQFLNRLKEQ
ncbi:MAG TPA: alpha/beta hydrolase [Ferruginibacter sp.]|nr:alpha/beta hydrolase [Ferruginibacter sp.]HMP21293.1 alpha/beta hydrolase [Ferruginibacter sp.]